MLAHADIDDTGPRDARGATERTMARSFFSAAFHHISALRLR